MPSQVFKVGRGCLLGIGQDVEKEQGLSTTLLDWKQCLPSTASYERARLPSGIVLDGTDLQRLK